MQPIVEFTGDLQARESLREWQERLYLTDWIISLALIDGTEIPGDQGRIEMCRTHRSAVIRIARLTDDLRSRIVRPAHEVTLVHELLHIIYDRYHDDTTDGAYAEDAEHTQIEAMARSLIMAKYGLLPQWWHNAPQTAAKTT